MESRSFCYQPGEGGKSNKAGSNRGEKEERKRKEPQELQRHAGSAVGEGPLVCFRRLNLGEDKRTGSFS